jgi:hypothetical protein
MSGLYAMGLRSMNWYFAGASSWDTPYGTWGLTDDMANQSTPKIQGIDAFLNQAAPVVTNGRPVPGVVDAQFRSTIWPISVARATRGMNLDFLLNAASAGTYQLQINAGNSCAGGPLDVSLNGSAVQPTSQIHIKTAGANVFVDSAPITLTLPSGLSVVRLSLPIGSLGDCEIRSLKIQK